MAADVCFLTSVNPRRHTVQEIAQPTPFNTDLSGGLVFVAGKGQVRRGARTRKMPATFKIVHFQPLM